MFTSKFVVGAIVAFAFLIQVAVGEGSGMILVDRAEYRQLKKYYDMALKREADGGVVTVTVDACIGTPPSTSITPAVPVYIGTPSVGTTTPTSEAIVTTISGSTTTVPISYVASVGSTTASTSVTTPTTFGNNSSVEVTTSLPSYFATVPVTTTKTSKTATHSQPITTTTASSAAQPEAELLTGRFRGGVPPYLVFFVALLCQCTLITWVIETITIGT